MTDSTHKTISEQLLDESVADFPAMSDASKGLGGAIDPATTETVPGDEPNPALTFAQMIVEAGTPTSQDTSAAAPTEPGAVKALELFFTKIPRHIALCEATVSEAGSRTVLHFIRFVNNPEAELIATRSSTMRTWTLGVYPANFAGLARLMFEAFKASPEAPAVSTATTRDQMPEHLRND